MKPIVCCPGSINPDLKLTTPDMKGPKTFFGEYSEDLGGKGCDTCCAIKRFVPAREVLLVGCVGKDRWNSYVMQRLEEMDVDARFVFEKPGITGIVLEYIYGNGEIMVGIEPGANRLLTIEDVQKAKKVIQGAALVIGQIENTIETLAESFRLAKEKDVPTLLDPSVVPNDDQGRWMLFNEVLPNTDILMPDRFEVEALTGIKPDSKKNLVKGAKQLLEHVKIVVVTLGKEGVFVSDRKGYRILPVYEVEAVDGGGVGDTFRGIFGYKVIEYCEQHRCTIDTVPFKALLTAARFASAAAAIAISRPGTCSVIPTREEIDDFMRMHD